MGTIAAIIPAAGYSSRMGLYKPLLPLGNSLVIEKTISALLQAGIDNIYVVIGNRAHLLKPVIERLGVNWIENTHFKQGMYSSIRAGVEALPKETDAFFLLPADTPLVSAATIKQLKISYIESPCDVIFPVYEGDRGHPPLISIKLRSAILQGELAGGLKVLLCEAANIRMSNTGDARILQDLDTEEDYRNMLPSALANYPTKIECERILTACKVSQPVILHTQQVAKLAGLMALYLNSQGYRLQLGLLQAACLLHDLAKGESRHAEKGQQLVHALGFVEVASIIATHMDLPEEHVQQIDEFSLLFLADKMLQGTAYVALERRKAEKIGFLQGNLFAQQAACERLDKALYLQEKLESLIGIPIAKIAGEL